MKTPSERDVFILSAPVAGMQAGGGEQARYDARYRENYGTFEKNAAGTGYYT